MAAETAVIAMDLEGVAISSGAACSSGKVRSSRVLAAMGVAPELAKAALRVSFGHDSTRSRCRCCARPRCARSPRAARARRSGVHERGEGNIVKHGRRRARA